MSSVYLALQTSLGRRVAVKVLKKFDSPQHAERFLHEARIIASLEHSNIITIYDVGTISDRHYIAMEYLEGGSLPDRIKQGMKPAAALSLLESIARCLDFVHRKDIVHRDIKPSNILFHADGTPKLSDFGIAKQLDGDQELTMDGSAFGSPYYLSPEQAECRSLDGRSDIYSLGIVFYQMLTGRRPYVEKSHIETIVAHLSQPIPLLPEELSGYQGLLECMIAKRPEDRVASAQELLQQIRRVRTLESSRRKAASANHHSIRSSGKGRPGGGIVGRLRGISSPFVNTVVLVSLVFAAGLLWLPGERQLAPDTVLTVDSRTVVQAADGSAAGQAEQQTRITPPEREESALRPDAQAVVEKIPDPPDRTELLPAGPVPTRPVEAVVLVELPAQVAEPAQAEERVVHAQRASHEEESVPLIEPLESDTVPEAPDGPDKRIAGWISAADHAMRVDRLTRPAGDNAYAYYLKVIDLDPNNKAARAGIEMIADRYAAIAQRALDRKDYSRARRYLRRGTMVRSRHAGLLRISSQLDEVDRAAGLAKATPPVKASPPVPLEPRISSREFEDTIVNSRGPEGTGNIVTDFKHVWHSVFD